jgi:hypothetical protein
MRESEHAAAEVYLEAGGTPESAELLRRTWTDPVLLIGPIGVRNAGFIRVFPPIFSGHKRYRRTQPWARGAACEGDVRKAWRISRHCEICER